MNGSTTKPPAGQIGLGAGFRPRHELVMQFTHGTADYPAKNGTNVIVAPRSGNRFHPTEKPVGLLEELLRVACTPEQYGGSVTTVSTDWLSIVSHNAIASAW